MQRFRVQVVPTHNKWRVGWRDGEPVSGTFDSMQEAVDTAKRILSNRGGGELLTLDEQGNIESQEQVPPADA